MIKPSKRNQRTKISAFALLLATIFATACSSEQKTATKHTYFPKEVWNVAENNNYQDSTSQFNIYRMKETPNLVAFWEAGFGQDPATTKDEKFRVKLDEMMSETEKMFVFYRDSLRFIEPGHSVTDSIRMMLYLYYNEDGTVYGGSADDTIGVMWLSPNRVQHYPYAAVAHELGHSFQFQVSIDGHPAFPGGSIYEMTSQYMLFQFYPNWMQLETYHLENFMKNTHKAFLHEDNMYCSPYVLEYWSGKYGINFVGRMWNEALEGEDPVMAYKRITGIDQASFNDEMLDAYLRFMTWDLPRIKDIAAEYANGHFTKLDKLDNGWYQIAEECCPQNYGYNGIELEIPADSTEIQLEFKGITGAEGFRQIQTEKAGWRYGFVAMTKNGERTYSQPFSDSEGIATFTVPAETTNLWLVVCGAPTEHWTHEIDQKPETDEQWPYQFKLTGTSPVAHIVTNN